ncbi:hypothetical protein G9A89_012818 [Geosiphon pyriformis]|nr:hypothetical protein G9A89_012818 [Geosiphon pyriformis]
MDFNELLPEILDDLFSYDEVKHKNVLDKYFATDAKLSHPLLTIEGSHNIRQVYRVWTSLNSLKPEIVESYLLDDKTAIVHTIQNFRPRMLPFIHLKVPGITTLRFNRTTDNDIEIYHQEDTWTLDGLIQSIPPLYWWYEHVVRVVMGKLFTSAGSFLQTANQTTLRLTSNVSEIRLLSSEVIAPYSEQATKFVTPYSNKISNITTQAKALVLNAQEEVKTKISQVRGIQPQSYTNGKMITQDGH